MINLSFMRFVIWTTLLQKISGFEFRRNNQAIRHFTRSVLRERQQQIFQMTDNMTAVVQLPPNVRPPKKFVPVPYQYHEEITVDIEDLTNEGDGIARDKGWVVMVPLVLPGERVVVRIYKNHAKFSEADLVRVVNPSPDRVTPLCPYFSECGGCQYQHMTIEAQRKWKRNQVKSLLEKIGQIYDVNVNDVVGTTDYLYGYRTKLTPHYDSPKSSESIKIGFQKRGTRNVIDIEQCIIATPPINNKYNEFRTSFLSELNDMKLPKRGATLLFRECEEGVETDARKIITQKVKDINFKFKAGEFFQNNAYVLPLMIDHVLKWANGHNCTHFIDTYCGSGLFALTAASDFQTVIGIEVSDLAVTAARNTAELNKKTNVHFVCGSAEKIFERVQHFPPSQTV